jgi:hypothetical protein
VALGLDSLVLGSRPGPIHRAAALLPLPAFLRRRIEDPGLLAPAAHVGAEHGSTLAGKAVAVVAAAALCVGGAGVTHKAAPGGLPLVGGSAQADQAGTTEGDGATRVGGEGAAGRPFDDPGSAIVGGAATPGVPAAAGSPGRPVVLGPGGLPGPGGPLGAVPGRSVDALGGTAVGTVERLGQGDAGGTLKTAGETVEQAPAKLKKQIKSGKKALENGIPAAAPALDGAKEKASKVKVKKLKDGAGQVGAVPVPGDLPDAQLPVGPTGLTVPQVLPGTGLGL